jgi:hypothetical protein
MVVKTDVVAADAITGAASNAAAISLVFMPPPVGLSEIVSWDWSRQAADRGFVTAPELQTWTVSRAASSSPAAALFCGIVVSATIARYAGRASPTKVAGGGEKGCLRKSRVAL